MSNRKAAAAYLGVCVRTIRHWDAGRCRVPWSVVRLLRLLRAGELGGLLDGWDGWTIYRDRLVSPDGRDYRERDMRRLWLTLTQARLFREGYDAATLPVSGGMDAAAPVHGACRGSGTTVSVPPQVPVGHETSTGTPLQRHGQGKAPSCPTALVPPVSRQRHRCNAAAACAGEAPGPEARRQSLWAPPRVGAGRSALSAPAGAGLVSSLKQVRSQPPKSKQGKASRGVSRAR